MDLEFVDADRLRSVLDMRTLIESLRAGHRAPTPMMERVLLEPDESSNRFLVWHAWGTSIASKLVTVFPDNPRRADARPSVQALITAFDGETGAPRAVIDGTELTYWKTAASSGLAADMLAPAEPSTLLIVGAGALAAHLVRAHVTVRPSIERVLIWNRTRSRAEMLASQVPAERAPSVVEDLGAAVRSADVISTATPSPTPLLEGRFLRSGSHVDLVGGFTPEMREADDDTVRRASIFVDARMFTVDHCGDISQPVAQGTISREDVRADLFDLCRDQHPGRIDREEITLYKSGGGAHLDLMATEHVLESIS